MKRLLLPLLAALALPAAVYSTTEIEPGPKSQILNNPFQRLGKSIGCNDQQEIQICLYGTSNVLIVRICTA